MYRLVLAIIFITSLTVASFASAQSLVVLDCQGFTRAAQTTDAGMKSKVEVKLSSSGAPADGAHVEITNLANSTVTSVISRNGLAIFENLDAGTYMLKVLESNIVIDTVSLGTMGVGLLGATAALAGGGAAAAGAVVGANDLVDRITGNGGGTDPTPAPTAAPATPTPGGHITPTPCPACDPDTDAPSLDDEDDFFAPTPPPLSPSR